MVFEELRMRCFVVKQLRECPDIGTLTQKKIRVRYLEHVARDSLSEEDRQLLKRIVEEELLKMEDSDSSDDEPLSKKLISKSSSSCKRKRGQKVEEETNGGLVEVALAKKRCRVDTESPVLEVERVGKEEKDAEVPESDDEEANIDTDSEEEEGKPTTAKKQQGKLKKSEMKPGCKRTKGNCDTAQLGHKVHKQTAEEAVQEKQNWRKERVVELDSKRVEGSKTPDEDSAEEVSKSLDKVWQTRKKREKSRAWLESEEEEEKQLVKKNGRGVKKNEDESPRGSPGNKSYSESESEGSGGAAVRRLQYANKGKGENSTQKVWKQRRIELSSDEEEKLDTRAEEEKEESTPDDTNSSSLPSLDEDEEGVSSKTKLDQVKKKTKAVGEVDGISKGRKGEENRTVSRLKRYIAVCGVRRNYKKLLDGCHSVKSQVAVLKRELEELGVVGQPSIEKCKKARLKREEALELAELDVTNIITTQGRPRRRAASLWLPAQAPTSLEPPYKRAVGSDSDSEEGDQCGAGQCRKGSAWRNLQGIISDDGDSE